MPRARRPRGQEQFSDSEKTHAYNEYHGKRDDYHRTDGAMQDHGYTEDQGPIKGESGNESKYHGYPERGNPRVPRLSRDHAHARGARQRKMKARRDLAPRSEDAERYAASDWQSHTPLRSTTGAIFPLGTMAGTPAGAATNLRNRKRKKG